VTSLTPASAINESDTYTLAGTFHDPGTLDTHAVVIAWGPGEGATALGNADLTYLGNGDWSFTASHQYLDDNPSGTPSDLYNISVSVTDDDTGVGTGATAVTVNNVAPVVTSLTPASAINEGDTYTLAGTFHDPGTLDTHAVVISWGPGEDTTTTSLAAGLCSFTASHQYLDDNPSGTPSDLYPVTASVTDDDTGVGTGSTSVTVNNVAPTVTRLSGPAAGSDDDSH